MSAEAIPAKSCPAHAGAAANRMTATNRIYLTPAPGAARKLRTRDSTLGGMATVRRTSNPGYDFGQLVDVGGKLTESVEYHYDPILMDLAGLDERGDHSLLRLLNGDDFGHLLVEVRLLSGHLLIEARLLGGLLFR